MFNTAPPLKQRLAQATSPLFGGFVFSTDPNICEVYAEAGFDFVVIDTEHGLNDVRTVHAHLRSCAATGISAVIRLGVASFPDVPRLLDGGAEAFMFPHLGLPGYGSDAAISAMKYPPLGNRPTCTGVQSAGYGILDFKKTTERANRNALAIGLIEDRECVEAIDSVLDATGVDWVMPGPGDLASSYDVHGQLRSPVVENAVETVLKAARKRNVTTGMYINEASEVARWQGQDIRFFIYSLDYKVMGKALQGAIAGCRSHIETVQTTEAR